MVTTDALGPGTFELGYWLSSEEHAPATLIRHAEMAEASGFATAMISDHLAPWVPQQGESGFVWSVLGGIATTTRDLRVGTGVSAPIHRMHPLVLAHAAATTETLMPGRFFLGLGTGERLNEAPMGRHWPRPGARRAMLREAVDVIRELWTGGVVTRADGPFMLERAQLFSLPDVPPPIVLAASGPRGARLAAEVGDGMVSADANPSLVDAFEAAGGREKPRMVQLHVCWAADDDQARRTVRRWWPNGGIPGSILTELPRPADFEDLAPALDDRAIQAAVISGPDPQPYLDAIERAVGAGFHTVYLHQAGPDQEGFLEFCRTRAPTGLHALMDTAPAGRSPRLETLRLLSDGRSAALVGPDAEVHWWCRPRFDSPPLCWSLLDPRGGRARWLDAAHAGSDGDPVGPTTRTLLRIGLAAHVEVWDGLVEAADGGTDLVRLVPAVDGAVEVWHSLKLGGFLEPWATWNGAHAEFDDLPSIGVFGGTTTFGTDGTALTRLQVDPTRWSAIVVGGVREVDPDVDALAARLAATEGDRERTAPRRVSRTHAERIRHSLAVLAACTDRATGAVIAAPTTSLPEVIGGNRQFDYRYSWLRDSSVAITAASLVGNHELAQEYVRFLTSLGPERILEAPIRTVDGGPVPEEHEVPEVDGWRGSRPVRVGNDASAQLQYDVLGFVLDAISTLRRTGGRLDRDLSAIVRRLADRAAMPSEPSSGIWEMREAAAFVSGDIGRWLALDRALRLTPRFRAVGARRRWRRARDEVRARVLGALQPDGSLPQVYDTPGVDASALLLVVFDLLPARDERAERLVNATIGALGAGPLLFRYPADGRDGFDAGEAPFVPASWWTVTALAKLGHPDAQTRADELCRMLPELQPEAFDPGRREALGNAPLLWSHAECTRALFELDRQASPLRRLRRRLDRWTP